MDAAERDQIVDRLGRAFGRAKDVTPADDQPLHLLLQSVELPKPWEPRKTRALTIWRNWPEERPEFYIDYAVVDGQHEPPRSNSNAFLLGETWRGFSFNFPWSGNDPVLVIQRWLTRFDKERP